MTLIVAYKNALVCDRRVALQGLHAQGSFTFAQKLYIHPDKTLAFGVAGPTLSHAENVILGIQLEMAIRENTKIGGDIPFPQFRERWIDKDPTIVVITKHGFYWMGRIQVTDLVFDEADYPIGCGTGMIVASLALQEGVPMNKVTEFVNEQDLTVSAEYDMITKSQLKAFKK